MIMINTGDGKGKTTAAVGQIIRSLGRGWKVLLIQLFKGEEFYGEQLILKKLKNLDFRSFAPRHPFCFRDTKAQDVRKQCLEALDFLKKNIRGKNQYNLIVLEEFNVALRDGFLKVKEVLEVIKQIPPDANIIITGRGAPKALVKVAGLVTEMKMIKHPYTKGIAAQKGLEY
ncbi:MAG: hypothetical protein A2219_02290 [Elusimicrobia bacterium RIFOXYA2_FULL_50_26]|nr:MAG: hypothetical protein A2219_02290 [Elusimicrobia bacterium RIFOXYA2_FULL_50_26]OGS24462.1 MAG: hypothetical protein A2314_06185 [Elusimicrobia bacterium RIFOXYB2_FULL_50_12]